MSIVFLARDTAGIPLVGLTPTWVVYVDAVAGSPISSPSFTAVGLGSYKFDPSGSNPAGIIDLGGGALPRYLHYSSFSTVFTFPAWDEFGAPLAGLTPTWHSLKRVSDGVDLTQPAISALGSGLYKTTFLLSEHATGAIDLSVAAFPRYFHYDSEPTVTTLLVPED